MPTPAILWLRTAECNQKRRITRCVVNLPQDMVRVEVKVDDADCDTLGHCKGFFPQVAEGLGTAKGISVRILFELFVI